MRGLLFCSICAQFIYGLAFLHWLAVGLLGSLIVVLLVFTQSWDVLLMPKLTTLLIASQIGYGFAYFIRFLWEEATAELPSKHSDPRRGVPHECVIYVGPGEGKSHAISPAQPNGMDDERARRWVHGELERLQRERKGSADSEGSPSGSPRS